MLSVVIISHNQSNELKRCIDSVLQQKTSFPVQVIVSDDRSTDGTRQMLTTEYDGKVLATFFDSNEKNTTFTLERASYNRLNGLKYVTGKYLINVDGDDFFTSTDLFQEMVDTLESHPECSVCCQNYRMVDSKHVLSMTLPQNKSELLTKNHIISGDELFASVGYLHSSCFLVRNKMLYNEDNINGIPYDDNTITARYIGTGMVAVLDRCDFVYVQYNNSTCATMSEQDKSILFLPEFKMCRLAPAFAGTLMRRNLGAFSYISGLIVRKENISEKIQAFFKKCDIFILNRLGNDISFLDKIRYYMIYCWTYLMFACHINGQFAYKILYRLSIGKISKDIKF